MSVEIPGKTSIMIVDGERGQVVSTKESDVIWEEVIASRTLRAMRFLGKCRAATHPAVEGAPSLHFAGHPFLLSLPVEETFLGLCRRLFWASCKCCADCRVPMVMEGRACNELAVGVYAHLTRKQRHAEASKFFYHLLLTSQSWAFMYVQLHSVKGAERNPL